MHCLLWLAGVPEIGTREYLAFLDRNISCSTTTTQRELVIKFQTHHHSSTCFKKQNSVCRFGFPRKPVTDTKILTDDEIEKNRGRFVEIKRTSEETFVNNYHPILLQMLKSNMDLQACTNTKAIAFYIAKYLSKAEPEIIRKEMADILEKAKEIEAPNKKEKLKKQARVIMRQREVSLQK